MREITEPVERSVSNARISYAQNMEDILLDRLFRGTTGTFLDLGANHPFLDSNTYFFYLRGWRGVNIEPNPRAVDLFRQYRPGDRHLPVAVADRDGELPFYEVISEEGSTGLSTLDRALAETHRTLPGVEVVETTVPVRTLGRLIEEHGIEPPDLVSIDVESQESAVIRSMPLDTWKPRVLVIESTTPLTGTASHEEWEPILLRHGYLFAAFNGVNRFYLREDLADHRELFSTPVNVLDHALRHDLVALSNLFQEHRARADHIQREFDAARLRHEELHRAWAWGQEQARQAQRLWERDRETWKEALEFFERSQADFVRQRAEFESKQGSWELERAEFARERAAWNLERAAWECQLVANQRLLRPYQLLDRLGLISLGYGWARRLKKWAVS